MRSRSLIVVGTLVVLLAACTGGGSTSVASKPPGDVVLLRTATGALSLATSSGAVLAQDPDAIVAPDGSHVYTATPDGRRTTLTTIDPQTGSTLSSVELDGTLEARAASLTGRSVALTAPRPAGVSGWTPIPRAHTTITVADPRGDRAVRRFGLDGNFEPEAFSADDARLFLIQYLPAEAPAAYRVTTLDLGNGRVSPVFGRFKTPPERMPGIRLRQTFDPTLDQLYTLYTNRPSAYLRNSGYDQGWAHRADEVTFVHVLNLREGWAYCAGMPRALWGQPANAQAMAPSPDGRLLYIVDSMRGIVTEMNTRSLEIVRTRHVDLGTGAGGQTAVVASPDGSRLFVASAADGSAVYTIDPSSLRVTGRWAESGPVADLRLSDDGARLYAALDGGLSVLDAGTGSLLGTYEADGVESIVSVETPVAAGEAG